MVAATLGPETAGVGFVVAGALEAASIGTGIAATAIDCHAAFDATCGIDIAATALGAGGATLRIASHIGAIAELVGEAAHTIGGVWGGIIGFSGSLNGFLGDAAAYAAPQRSGASASACEAVS